jgi:hypothetical protein
MKREYTGTLFISDLTKVEVRLDIYDKPKYEVQEKEPKTVRYNNVTQWDIIEGGEEAEEIENMFDGNDLDENHEYLVLHFASGDTATYRNSHVAMFII